MLFNVVRRGLVLGASLATLVAGSASAAVIHGVVVSHNLRAHSFVVTQQKGKLVAIHSRRTPAVGRVVAVRAKRLLNGTYAAQRINARRQVKHRVLIKGVVTFVNRRMGEFTVSAGGASLLVHRSSAAGRAADATTSSSLPSVGDEVTVDAQIDGQGDLEDQGVQSGGTESQNIDIEGTILSVDTTASALTVSADGEDDTTQSITVDVPSTMDITMFQVGQQVELTVAVQPDGSFLLQGSSEDGNSNQANSSGDQQGCQGDGPGNSCSQAGGDGSGSQGDGGSGGSAGSQGDGGSAGSGSSGGDGSSGSGSGGDTSGSSGAGSGD